MRVVALRQHRVFDVLRWMGRFEGEQRNDAAAMDKLYPVPPVPVDRQNRPMPWLQQPKPVTVSAEANSNTLMIYASADQMESLKALAEKPDLTAEQRQAVRDLMTETVQPDPRAAESPKPAPPP